MLLCKVWLGRHKSFMETRISAKVSLRLLLLVVIVSLSVTMMREMTEVTKYSVRCGIG